MAIKKNAESKPKTINLWRCEKCTHKWEASTSSRQSVCPKCLSEDIAYFK